MCVTRTAVNTKGAKPQESGLNQLNELNEEGHFRRSRFVFSLSVCFAGQTRFFLRVFASLLLIPSGLRGFLGAEGGVLLAEASQFVGDGLNGFARFTWIHLDSLGLTRTGRLRTLEPGLWSFREAASSPFPTVSFSVSSACSAGKTWAMSRLSKRRSRACFSISGVVSPCQPSLRNCMKRSSRSMAR
jgi:hypothetical protein